MFRQRLSNLFVIRLAGQTCALDLVDNQPRDRLQRVRQNLLPIGRGVESNAQAPLVRLFHDVGHVIDLILQNKNIARCKVRQDLVGIVLRNLAVGAAVENDAVLPAALDLNDRVTVRAFAQPHETGIHARFLHFIEQELAFGSIKPRMVDLRTRLRQRNRLVESLAAAAGRQRRTGRGFAGSYKMLHLIDIVNVARTKIQNLHGKASLSFV